MQITDLLDFIKSKLPEQADDLLQLTSMLIEKLDETRNVVKELGTKRMLQDDNTIARKCIDVSEELYKLIIQLNENMNVLQPVEEYFSTLDKNIERVDYDNYLVDESVAYCLDDDLTFKRPLAFEFGGKRFIADTWANMLVKTCEILYSIDSTKFRGFLTDTTMQGKTRFYFTTNQDNMGKRNNTLINGTDIYVLTNLSANDISKLIMKMLRKFDINFELFKIYLHKDLSPLHDRD